ncbi:hypothetical protein DFJ67_3818 [Asanoa ferruginea]|uniref:Squalene cyclase C-terminal domain-containing protein n=1 Tax=Asanoa ferruginea TaxID=53367 RepID=A0A3D9ZKT0_9ACTN|nr:hypothetical protein [Asanoa ferruginea]REF97811.1 hypothetical protein DFJ67_3818 [Asanoa ferruginea]GIF51918.1 hypothetical protein Afe04nite_64570 [Asanoa ferruginea]
MTVMDWLLDSDPAVRWQAMRDLGGAPADTVAAERARVAREGWGARLLALQDAGGGWAGGACFPGGGYRHTGPDHEPPPNGEDGQPWVSTLPTLDVLVELGVDPNDEQVQKAVTAAGDNVKWEHDSQAFFDGEVEACINGRTVRIGAYFGQPVDGIVERLLREQYPDGGWNCELERGSKVSSFASTINVLDGLLTYQQAGGTHDVSAARLRGEEYLLERSLFRRKSTGAVVDEDWLGFSFPFRWHYDVLRALDYFRATGEKPAPRIKEAVELVESKRQPDGTWLLENTHPGLVFFSLEAGDGQPSRWNTLRALRVLAWAQSATNPD